MSKPISPEVVAEKIITSITNTIDEIQRDTESKSTKIEVDVKIPKARLREISERRHIRAAFIKEVQNHLNNQGYDTDVVNGTICVSEEVESEPDTYSIESI